MPILVTGATGFTGGRLAAHLAANGEAVRALVRKGSDTSYLEDRGIEFFEGDITDPEAVDRAVQGCEKVYHIAACFRTAGHPDSYYHDVNVKGTQYVLDAAKKWDCERVVHCSTIGVHGSVKKIPSDETAPYSPGDIYQKTKLEGELLAKERQKQGQPIAIFRPAGIYGPGDMRLLKLFKMIHTGRFRMIGPGKVNFHMVYIDDLVDGILLCGQKREALGDTFILCGPDYVPLKKLVQLVADAVGVEPPRGHIPLAPVYAAATLCELICIPLRIEPPLHRRRVAFFTKNRSFTHAKASRLLGYEPKIDAAEGVRRTAAWYFENGHL
ncbi:MAG: NAD-dependent epimerase/dehydratase family protein [Phycisphaeraceae bacterium]